MSEGLAGSATGSFCSVGRKVLSGKAQVFAVFSREGGDHRLESEVPRTLLRSAGRLTSAENFSLGNGLVFGNGREIRRLLLVQLANRFSE